MADLRKDFKNWLLTVKSTKKLRQIDILEESVLFTKKFCNKQAIYGA